MIRPEVLDFKIGNTRTVKVGRSYFVCFELVDENPKYIVGLNVAAMKRIPGGWFTTFDTVDEVVEAGQWHGTIDFAVPQDWWNENRWEITRRGGYAVWHYGEHGIFGHPLFADELEARALGNIADALSLRIERDNREVG